VFERGGASEKGDVKKMENANKKGFLQSTKMFVLFNVRVSKNKSSNVVLMLWRLYSENRENAAQKKKGKMIKKSARKCEQRKITSFAQNTRGIAHKTKV
jgi:hypothetical protein